MNSFLVVMRRRVMFKISVTDAIKDLEIDGKDVMKYMLMDECPEVGYWLKHILKMVIDGDLRNNRDDLIYYMIGVTDGWLELK